MNVVTTPKEVEEFLTAFKAGVGTEVFTVWTTAKNDAFLLESGFTNRDIEVIVRSLAVKDYSSGPEDDDKADIRGIGEIWVFSKEYEGFDLYVKLKRANGKVALCECLSVHEAEFPMKTPMGRKK